jgi:hypothetical protein
MRLVFIYIKYFLNNFFYINFFFNKNYYFINFCKEGFLIDFIQKSYLNSFIFNWIILGSQKINFKFFNKILINFILSYIIKLLANIFNINIVFSFNWLLFKLIIILIFFLQIYFFIFFYNIIGF